MWIALAMLAASCAGTGGGGEACAPWRPVLVSDADVLSEATARAILAHNRTGRRICGW
jgi:hypothetical protein